MSRRFRRFLIVFALILNGHAAYADDLDVGIVFSQPEIEIIRDYYHQERHAGSGRGKHKHKGLPPGIAKNLQRGKRLPPGIAKKYLPDDLERELPPPPAGHERIVIGAKIVLIEVATQIIRDVLSGIILD